MVAERRFSARIEVDGVNPYVDVPSRTDGTFQEGPHVPVLVRVAPAGEPSPGAGRRFASDADRLIAIGRLTEEGWFRTSLLRSPHRPTRLFLDAWMRDVSGAGVGDRVRITLRPDDAPRDLAMPDVLVEALAADAEATAAWQRLAPSRRQEILGYLGFLRTDVALERNVRKTIDRLKR